MDYSLNGKWILYFGRQTADELTDEVKQSLTQIEAQVPGNVELDLMKAGYLPKDIYMGENILVHRIINN